MRQTQLLHSLVPHTLGLCWVIRLISSAAQRVLAIGIWEFGHWKVGAAFLHHHHTLCIVKASVVVVCMYQAGLDCLFRPSKYMCCALLPAGTCSSLHPSNSRSPLRKRMPRQQQPRPLRGQLHWTPTGSR